MDSGTSLWRNRDYVLLWLGQTISVTGTQISQVAFPLLVLAMTGSAAIAGFVAAARTVPYLLFTLPAGALVDRWDRKRTMMVCGLGSGLALLSIPIAHFSGQITIAQIVAVSFLEGTFAVVYGLAETAALPSVVSKAMLPNAVAQQQLQYSISGIVGPPLGGALYGASAMVPFALDAASYAASAGTVVAIKRPLTGVRSNRGTSFRREIGEGVSWLWNHSLIRYMAFLTGMLNFAGSGITLIVIVLAKEQGASAAMTGLVLASAGAGGVIGAIIAPRIQRKLAFGQAIPFLNWALAILILAYSVAVSPYALMALLFLESVIGPSYDTVQVTYRLAVIPEALLGRVNSVFRLVGVGLGPIGLALTGVLLESVGGTVTALTMGGILILVAIVTSLNSQVRNAPAIDQLMNSGPATAQ